MQVTLSYCHDLKWCRRFTSHLNQIQRESGYGSFKGIFEWYPWDDDRLNKERFVKIMYEWVPLITSWWFPQTLRAFIEMNPGQSIVLHKKKDLKLKAEAIYLQATPVEVSDTLYDFLSLYSGGLTIEKLWANKRKDIYRWVLIGWSVMDLVWIFIGSTLGRQWTILNRRRGRIWQPYSIIYLVMENVIASMSLPDLSLQETRCSSSMLQKSPQVSWHDMSTIDAESVRRRWQVLYIMLDDWCHILIEGKDGTLSWSIMNPSLMYRSMNGWIITNDNSARAAPAPVCA